LDFGIYGKSAGNHLRSGDCNGLIMSGVIGRRLQQNQRMANSAANNRMKNMATPPGNNHTNTQTVNRMSTYCSHFINKVQY